jgi:hypothetical protein
MARFAPALLVLAAIAALGGCQPARSKTAGRVGMVMAISGVAAIMASVAATPYTEHSEDMMLGASAVSAAGIVLYASHELSGPEIVYKQETPTQRHSRWARILTEHAAGAARSGNCARVRKFEPRVRVYDPNIHDFVFMRDPEILRCLSPDPPTDAPAPTDPLPSPAEP